MRPLPFFRAILLTPPLLLGAIGAPCKAQQEWATSGSHIYNANSGLVGIGVVPTNMRSASVKVSPLPAEISAEVNSTTAPTAMGSMADGPTGALATRSSIAGT